MRKILALFIVITAMAVCSFSSFVYAEDYKTDLVFFWGEGCPHCKKAEPFMEELKNKYPSLEIHSLETWRNKDNAKTFHDLAEAYNIQARGVPSFFIGNYDPIVGYSFAKQEEFYSKIEYCLKNGCANPLDRISNNSTVLKINDAEEASKDVIEAEDAELPVYANKTVMYFFWGDGCPHCEAAKPFVKELKENFPSLEVRMVETWKNQEGNKTFNEIAKAYGVPPRGVPAFVIGDNQPVFGFADHLKSMLTEKVKTCVEKGCVNPAVKAGLEKANPLLDDRKLCIHMFYRPDCPHCINVQGFLKGLEDDKDIEIFRHNVYETSEKELFDLFKEKYGLTQVSYPVVFVGGKFFVGERSVLNNLEKTVDICKVEDCHCPAERVLASTPVIPRSKDITPDEGTTVSLPFFGEINLAKSPIFVTTSIIAFVDGFNPCSTWLIMFLLGMVIYTKSRKKVLLVSLTFLMITALAYGAFMIGLLNVFTYVGYLGWIQVTVALMALLFAVINIKDYFWFKKGISFTISDKHKPGIFKNMREIIKPDKSTIAMLTGTIILALGVVLVELPCTAGFPVIWANLLAQNDIHGMYFAVLFAIYILIYLLDELVIIFAAVITLKTSRFEEKHGRVLKLIGGLVMASLAGFMLLAPETLNSLEGTLLVFTIAAIASVLIILLHRKILPKFGIKIGTDETLK